ncbi:Reverse transcriptase RNA-dependent DNA polymerase [Trinorchestia longiramus]|nr:Reverse transcriptase RNA-dependent DNA polymerase [Trinorchestia longiramus]
MIEDEFITVDNPAELKQSGKTDKAEAELKPGTVPEGIQNETHLDEKPTRRFPLREKKLPIYLKDYVDPDECDITNHVVDYCYRVNSIPKSYSEAISSPDSVEWQKAMSDEMAALVDNETFELVAKPKERSVIGGRWVYSVKSGPNDQEIFKARYVAKGHSQVADVDFTETFSPTARLTSVRMLMDIAVQESYIVHQMDVCTAYLHAKIDCNVFVEQPEGFIELDKNGENGDKFDVPANVEEALHGPESKLWKAAMEEEMASMNINNVWSLVECPKNKKPTRCKWIFKRKTGPDGNVCSYKVRLVAQGYAQKFGVVYDETFSPVVRFESVRAVLAPAAKPNLQLHHMDVATAFLNGELSGEIYLTQPEGFVSEGNENLVCRLNKFLYGLKQSPKCWNTALDGHLKQLRFKQSKNDACIYTRVSNKGSCIIAVYVDDIIIASDCLDEINEVKSCLSAKYKMKELGQLSNFLGVSVMQTKNEVFLEQSAYTKALLSRFGMDNANSIATPVDVNADLVTTSDEVEECDKDLYQSAVGSLLYLSTRTRPDIILL